MLANIRRRAAELLYSHLRHATHLQNRADQQQNRADQLQHGVEQLQHEADDLRAQLAGSAGARAQLEHDVAVQIAGRTNDAHAYRAMLGKSFLMQRNFYDVLKVDLAGATSSQATSIAMLRRIQAAYRQAGATELNPHDSFWTTAADYAKQPIHDALLAEDTAALEKVFAAPVETSLFYGFDTLNQANQGNMHPSEHQWRADWSYDNLLRLCEAVGVVRLEYPEAPARTSYPETEELLEKLDAALGFRIDFPNLYAGETGLKTSRGAASYRAVQALYQAWLIRKTGAEKVVEIGAGMVRTAYYASRFGIRDYTIVDLPLTNVSQAGFLALTLGEQSVALYG